MGLEGLLGFPSTVSSGVQCCDMGSGYSHPSWRSWRCKKQSASALLSLLGQRWSSALICCKPVSSPRTISTVILCVWISSLLTVKYYVPDAKWTQVMESTDFYLVDF